MSNQPRLIPTNQKTWTNRHESFVQPLDNLYDVDNGETDSVLNDYNNTTAAIQSFLSISINSGKEVRGLGGGWSFTKVAATTGGLLNTKMMNLVFTILPESISASYQGDRSQLLFAQCGNSIKELHDFLNGKGKSLKTCGASNGQTIVGAFSTGTHGSAIDFGSTPDFIVGLHIVLSPTRHIYLERASYPVAADAFASKIHAELVRSDELFNAALVSFGSFGFIHGVMLESENIFLLESFRQKMDLNDAIRSLMQTLDFSNSTILPHGSERPFHFQVLINPYQLPNGAYVTTMYKRPYVTGYTPPVNSVDNAGPGDGAAEFIGKIFDVASPLIPTLVNVLINSQYAPHGALLGTLNEIFCTSDTRGKVMSAAMGIPLEFVNKVTDMLLNLNNSPNGSFGGVFSYRYVGKSLGTLAFTRFGPSTCVLELDGVFSNNTTRFYRSAWDELDKMKIPYTFHWGKLNNLNDQKVKDKYGDSRLSWINARNQLLPQSSQTIFTNQQLRDWGLDN
jgi:hypothetical protein